MRCRVLVAVLVVSVALGGTRMWATPGGRGAVGRSAQGYLGVEVRDLSDDEVAALKINDTRGAEITRLDHDGPACKAGVREHDVVLQMDGRAIDGQEQFRRLLHESSAGRQVVLLVLRDGQQLTLHATMANREEVERQAWSQHMTVVNPDGTSLASQEQPVGQSRGGELGFVNGGPAAAPAPAAKSHSFLGTMLGSTYIGAVVEPVGPQLGEFFGVPSGMGLLVKSVDANSPAAVAGMRAGDVVIKANQMRMATESDWTKSLHENKGRPMPVLVLRDKKEQTLTLTPEAKRRAMLQPPRTGGDVDDARLREMNLL